MDLNSVISLFSLVNRFEWYSLPTETSNAGSEKIRSLVCLHGIVAGAHEVRLELLATPPDFVGPGLHCRPDGAIYETK
jgi:hypothetical protein